MSNCLSCLAQGNVEENICQILLKNERNMKHRPIHEFFLFTKRCLYYLLLSFVNQPNSQQDISKVEAELFFNSLPFNEMLSRGSAAQLEEVDIPLCVHRASCHITFYNSDNSSQLPKLYFPKVLGVSFKRRLHPS